MGTMAKVRDTNASAQREIVGGPDSLRVGVLALQGDYATHLQALTALGAKAEPIRRVDQLDDLHGLILPGGESTTLWKLLAREQMDVALRKFQNRGGALFGTCAGLILLARSVCDPVQPSLGFIDIDVRRNGYGRQRESFIDEGELLWSGQTVEMPFIRAPRILRVGSEVEVLAQWQGEPVLVREGSVLAGTFHPELLGDNPVHRYFLDEVVCTATRQGQPS